VDVYLAMTGGQSALALDSGARAEAARVHASTASLRVPGVSLAVPVANEDEMRQHEVMLELISKSSGGKAVWRALEAAAAGAPAN